MSAKTRADLIEVLADRYGEYRQGTATGGSTSTCVDTSGLYEANDAWIGHYLYILTDAGGASAAPEGEERPVTDFVQSTATLTVSPVFTAAVASGDTYELLPVRREVLARAINAGVRAAGDGWLVGTVDTTTVTLADDDYDYTLPTDIVRLMRVLYRDASDESYKDLPGWRVSGTPGAQVLLLDSLQGLDSGDTLRLEYLARPSELTADTSSLGLGEPAETEAVRYIIEYALAWLHERAAASGGDQFREHLTLAKAATERAAAILQGARRSDAGTVHAYRWPRARG